MATYDNQFPVPGNPRDWKGAGRTWKWKKCHSTGGKWKALENTRAMQAHFEMSLSAKGIYFNVFYASYAEKFAMDSILKEVIS